MKLERLVLRWQSFLNQHSRTGVIYGIFLILLGLMGFKKAGWVLSWLNKWRKTWQYPTIGEKIGVPLIKGFSFLVAFLGLVYILLVMGLVK